MPGKDAEVRDVAARLDALLAALQQNVDALNAILVRPAGKPDGAGKEKAQP